jgi:hypothetical protein
MRLLSLLVVMCLAACAVDIPVAGPEARRCLKTGAMRGEMVQWRCENGLYWISDRSFR